MMYSCSHLDTQHSTEHILSLVLCTVIPDQLQPLDCVQLLTAAGFGATVRDSAAPASAAAATILRKRDERAQRLADSTTRLILSWTLAITCFAGASATVSSLFCDARVLLCVPSHHTGGCSSQLRPDCSCPFLLPLVLVHARRHNLMGSSRERTCACRVAVHLNGGAAPSPQSDCGWHGCWPGYDGKSTAPMYV